ncbi:hypothetical protein [Pseudomonas phage Astolliot]|nr:hypothetical protein [Pseudomonas phage Astolliot]
MKRENFEISFEGQTIIKHKWNSSIRAIESKIREIADAERPATYSLVDSVSNKTGFYHTSGSRTWERQDGKRIIFTIKKLD